MGFYLWAPAVVIVLAVVAVIARRYFALRGERLVECPENQEAASVSVKAGRAALGGGFALADCSRWPGKQACGRQCLAEIERAPGDCLVRNRVTRWYEDKSCAICGKPLGAVDWYDRKPAVIEAGGRTRAWADIPAETLPQVFSTCRPVCFDCHVAETFRREHPELVLDNPWTPAPPRGA